jgi:hypothetical protein
VLLELVQILNRRMPLALAVRRLPLFPRWTLYLAGVYLVIMFGVFRNAQFIYFQF